MGAHMTGVSQQKKDSSYFSHEEYEKTLKCCGCIGQRKLLSKLTEDSRKSPNHEMVENELNHLKMRYPIWASRYPQEELSRAEELGFAILQDLILQKQTIEHIEIMLQKAESKPALCSQNGPIMNKFIWRARKYVHMRVGVELLLSFTLLVGFFISVVHCNINL